MLLLVAKVLVVGGCTDVVLVVTSNNISVLSASSVSLVMMNVMMTLTTKTMKILVLIWVDVGEREGLG